jgi:hypothetical protein
MKMTPDLVRAIVPGSASLYATNICIILQSSIINRKVGNWSPTVLFIKEYSNAKFANPYLVSTDTSVRAPTHKKKRFCLGTALTRASSTSSLRVSSEDFSSSSSSPFRPSTRLANLTSATRLMGSEVHSRDLILQNSVGTFSSIAEARVRQRVGV